MTDKMELTKHHKATGNHGRTVVPDASRCAHTIWSGFITGNTQCTRKRHPDTLDGAFCKQHCPERRKAKQEARDAKWRAENAAALAEREKAARMDELRREAAAILVDIGASDVVELHPWQVHAIEDWLAKWEAAQ